MSAGSRPGERRGGRRKGTPNKATLKRAEEIAAQAKSSGRKLGREILSDFANIFAGLAAKHQPGSQEDNPGLFKEYGYKAAQIAQWLAPYETPRLATVTVKDEALDLSRLTDDELAQLKRLTLRAAMVNGSDRGRGETTRH